MSKKLSPNQKLFNIAVRKLLKQNQKSVSATTINMDGSSSCAYRGTDGLRCAIGHAIPDRLYCKEMEGESTDGISVKTVLSNLGYTNSDFNMKLQQVHDFYEPCQWREMFQDLANQYNLTFPANV
jgi:hypothetical protein